MIIAGLIIIHAVISQTNQFGYRGIGKFFPARMAQGHSEEAVLFPLPLLCFFPEIFFQQTVGTTFHVHKSYKFISSHPVAQAGIAFVCIFPTGSAEALAHSPDQFVPPLHGPWYRWHS